MTLRVLKFGGTSVGSPEKILAVAGRIAELHRRGDRVLVVVSAMGQTTDELSALAHRITDRPPRREMDMLLTAGERISMALLAMALTTMDCPAISFTGSQSGIITDEEHADARIAAVRPFRIEDELDRGKIVIIAGFQGVSGEKEVTTLGRGGSDTTAVAMAIRLGAERSEIHTDVPGVLTADPRIVPSARPIASLAFDPMIVLSHFGGRVLFWRALRLARRYGHPLLVRSAHEDAEGTSIVPTTHRPPLSLEETEPMESDRPIAIAQENPVSWIRTEWNQGSCPRLPDQLASVTCLLHRQSHDGEVIQAEWIVPQSPMELARESWERADGESEPSRSADTPNRFQIDREHGLVSLIGDSANLGSSWGPAAVSLLTEANIPVRFVQSGAHALSLLVPQSQCSEACRVLHAEFLEKD